MKKELGVFIATATSVAMAFSGCGGAAVSSTAASTATSQSGTVESATNEEEKQVTLSFMNHTSEENKVAWEDSVIEGFENEHPNVTIEVQRMSYDDYIQTLQTKFASGDAPDIYALENAYIEKYIENKYVANLDDTDASKAFSAGALDMLSVDGSVYAIPYSAGTMDVTYNKDVFAACGIEAVPKTLDEFYVDCEKIKAAGYVPIGAGYADTWCLMADLQADYLAGVLLKDNNAILDVQSRAKKFVDSEEWKGVFERIQARLAYANDDPFGTNWDTVCTDIANGTTAMTLNGNWSPNNILAMNADANLGSFAMPTTNNAEDTVFAMQSPTEGYALNAESENLGVAKEFLNYYVSSTNVDSFVASISEICIVNGADTSGAKGALKDIMDAVNDGTGAKSLGAVDHNFSNEYRDAVQTVVADFLLNGKTVDDCLKNLDAEFDRIAG